MKRSLLLVPLASLTLLSQASELRAAEGASAAEAVEVDSPEEGSPEAQSSEVELQESKEAAAERAREAFRSGQQSFAEGRFVQAARFFEEAHAIHPHAAVLFNMARAWHQAEELERAADAFAAAIKRGELEFEQANTAQETLERLRTRLGWAKMTGAPGLRVTVGYHDEVPLPLQTHLAPGEHTLVAVNEGGDSWTQTITIVADRPQSVVVTPPKEEAPAPAVVEVPPPVVDDGKRRRQRTWGFATLGVGGGLGVASAILGAATLNSKDKYESSEPLDPELYSQTKSLRTWTNVAAFSGLAVGATGAVLLLTLPQDNAEEQPIALAVEPGRVSLRGAF